MGQTSVRTSWCLFVISVALGCSTSPRGSASDAATGDAAPGGPDTPTTPDATAIPDGSAMEAAACLAPLPSPPGVEDPTDVPATDPARAAEQHRFFRITVK